MTATKTCGHCKREVAPVARGTHRLLCGDSTDAESVARLFGGEKAALVASDPPYGLDYVGKTKDALVVHNDGAEFEDVSRRAFENACAHVLPGGTLYAAAAAGPQLAGAMAAFDASGFTLKHVLVWVKDQFVMGRSDYHYRHETILYGWKEDGPHYFVDDRKQDSVFEFPRPKASVDHPTMKPVELYERLVANSSKPGDLVYEPFGGSGTTLIACAKQGRRCFAVELSPNYVDVIRRRWTTFARSAGVEPGTGALE